MSSTNAQQRKWYRTSTRELKVFVGICIYVGLYPQPMTELWSADESGPVHPIRHHMAKNRFFQLRRFFHISGPKQWYEPTTRAARISAEGEEAEDRWEDEGLEAEDRWEEDSEFDEAPELPELDDGNGDNPDDEDTILAPEENRWWHKMEPLASTFREACRSRWLPGSTVAIDEMMIRCHGRSPDTVKARKKPIKKGYRMWAMCDDGYLFFFMYSSRRCHTGELRLCPGLSATGSMILQFSQTLPSAATPCTIYMDNYFTSQPLFQVLRDRGIGACGTTRPNRAGFPPLLRAFKDQKFAAVGENLPLSLELFLDANQSIDRLFLGVLWWLYRLQTCFAWAGPITPRCLFSPRYIPSVKSLILWRNSAGHQLDSRQIRGMLGGLLTVALESCSQFPV